MTTLSGSGKTRLRRYVRPLAVGVALGALLATPVLAGTAPTLPVAASQSAPADRQSARPDIVVVLLDDVVFAASATFGGAVRTPALDSLSASGITYNRFHTPSGRPIRSMAIARIGPICSVLLVASPTRG